ncbi:general transcription factor IIF subunit 1 isoform X2 [Gouania willdenowi]|uniref:general transcription factor IIF subunit 1 isoform X2 n=1 Tax=Gouania willdenowi TaxID=441366 RepID=UPI0010542F23|nr:general transcription factor IIF subunit 1 isoform X2 [Gouania willdenowi]
MTSLGGSSSSTTEYTVRVPKNTSKRYNIMAFNAGDRVNCSTWTQARMERDMSARRIYGDDESAEGAGGSEFGKKQRDEARRRKYGIITKEFKAEDQPWILKVNGKGGKRFKGLRKGGVTENASYYIFTQCPDGAFEAFPVNGWYNFTPQAKHRTLTAEEAEEEWGRRNKVVNHFSIMLQKRFREQERGGDDEDESEKTGKKKKNIGRGGELHITDLEDDLMMSSDNSDSSMGEDADGKSKAKKNVGKGKKKKRKSNDKEAVEESDDGDYEGLEVDYMSDESSSDEEPEKGKPSKTEEHLKGIDEASESEEESEEEKPNEEEAKEEEEEEEGKKTPVQTEKKKKKDSSGESESSDDSDIEGETASALFMMKKRTPPKRPSGRGSAGSSKTGSRPGTPSIDSATTSNTLRAAASKLEQGKRQNQGPTESPAAKRLKMDPSSQSPAPSGKSTPQPPSGKSTPSSSDVQLTEEAVRRYLIRKPMTTKDLLKKFQTKRTGLSSEQTVNVLAQILKRLNPERKIINDKMHFYLTE